MKKSLETYQLYKQAKNIVLGQWEKQKEERVMIYMLGLEQNEEKKIYIYNS